MKYTTDEKLEAVENALFEIREAMSSLRGIEEYKDTLDSLKDIESNLEDEQSELERAAAGEYIEYMHEMTRDYYRSVM